MRRVFGAATVIAVCAAVLGFAPAAGIKTYRLSAGVAGQGNAASGFAAFAPNGPSFEQTTARAPSTSANGRFTAFVSEASNLSVEPDTNMVSDVYVHDFYTGFTTRVSVDTLGREANGPSRAPSISADGRLIAFESDASNLVGGDFNGVTDVFVHDMQIGETTSLTSSYVSEDPSRAPSISPDGLVVAFESDAAIDDVDNGFTDIFMERLDRGVTEPISVGLGGETDGDSRFPSVTNGYVVAFESDATNLVPADLNGTRDVFISSRNGMLGVTVGGNGPSTGARLNRSGETVAFASESTNLQPGVLDNNGVSDVFVWSAYQGAHRVSVSSAGEGNGPSLAPSISADGARIAFLSGAKNLGGRGQSDAVFIASLADGFIEPISGGNGPSYAPAISADGSFIAYASDASDLVPQDTNGARDVFGWVDERSCPAGPEDGLASNAVHGAEPATGPAETLVHRVNCDVLVPLGL